MKNNNYLRFYETEEDAYSAMVRHNKILKIRKHRSAEIYVMVDGPEDNYAAIDLNSAIEAGFTYTFA